MFVMISVDTYFELWLDYYCLLLLLKFDGFLHCPEGAMNILNKMSRVWHSSALTSRSLLVCGSLLALTGCGDGPNNDTDGDGFTLPADCNNLDSSVYPGAEDVCTDGIDQDCSGSANRDCDGDGYEPPADCDDSDKDAYPGAPEKDYDNIDQDCDGTDNNDKDGDGFTSVRVGGLDCDDLDGTVHPGASEIAYDGIDQDCVDGDLVDVDEDGFPGALSQGENDAILDCADQNPAIHPGAAEVAYDSIDQDCTGDDLTDVDQDGYDSVQVGGTDCADSDPKAHPNASEVPYDGIDQDCNGQDLNDADLDGFAVNNDCDDSQAAIHPGASEVSCNSVDEDCDGLRRDEDCDSYISLAMGGDDCNDQDANVHPQALEARNGSDDNCDGAVDETVPLERASATILTSPKIHSGMAMRSADLDGDGLNELIFGAPGFSDSEAAGRGVVYIVPGSAEGMSSLDLTSGLGPVLTIRGTAAGDAFGSSIAITDLDQDGRFELLVGAPFASGPEGRAGAVYIFPGYQQLWTQNPRADEATYVLNGPEEDAEFGAVMEVLGDVDGHGQPDFMIGAPNADGNNKPQAGRAWLFAGERLALLEDVEDAMLKVAGNQPHGHLGASLGGAADFNGDGYKDVVVGVPGSNGDNGSVQVYFGRSNMAEVSGDEPVAVLLSEGVLDDHGNLGQVMTPGDVNGDGLDDLVVAAPNAGDSGSGRVFLYFGRTDGWSGEIDLNRRYNGLVEGEHPGDGLGAQLGSGLITDDDLADIVIGTNPGSNASVYLFAGRIGSNFETLSISTALASFSADEERSLSGTVLSSDLDQDGLSDLVLAGRSTDLNSSEFDSLFIFQWL